MGLLAPTARGWVDNRAGWRLEIKRYADPARLDPSRRPVLMIPGYAMNSFILAFHPRGESVVEYLVQDGLEVWTCNLRGQGNTHALTSDRRRFGLGELALVDLPAVFDHVLEHTRTDADRLDPIGCSLGASILYAYLAHHGEDHPLGRIVSLGGPLRWDDVHPLLNVAFSSGRLAGALRLRGTRRIARLALPVVKRAPALLSVYMNARHVDLSAADQLVNTVENPIPWINRQIARWVRNRDLVVRGVDVTEALRSVDDLEALCIYANADGIVPPAAAASLVDVWGDRVRTLEVGDDDRWYAHADLFIGDGCQDTVFEPLRGFLAG